MFEAGFFEQYNELRKQYKPLGYLAQLAMDYDYILRPIYEDLKLYSNNITSLYEYFDLIYKNYIKKFYKLYPLPTTHITHNMILKKLPREVIRLSYKNALRCLTKDEMERIDEQLKTLVIICGRGGIIDSRNIFNRLIYAYIEVYE